MSYDSLLTDTCSVLRRTEGTFDPGTGAYGPPTDTAVYAGPCRVTTAPTSGTTGQRVQVGEEAVINFARWVFLPPDTTGVKAEDIVAVNASENADIVGRELTVKIVSAEPSPNSALAARFLICEDFLEGT